MAYAKGTGTVTGPNEVKVTGLDGTTSTIRAKNIVIATGSEVDPLGGITVCSFFFICSTGVCTCCMYVCVCVCCC